MPYEQARAHDEIGRHLVPGDRSLLGADRTAHLDRAMTGFRTAGCSADLRRVRALVEQAVT